jgi:hypothetical protein
MLGHVRAQLRCLKLLRGSGGLCDILMATCEQTFKSSLAFLSGQQQPEGPEELGVNFDVQGPDGDLWRNCLSVQQHPIRPLPMSNQWHVARGVRIARLEERRAG